jgi:parvulin-like peptidyl-prolyl isomerase
MLRGFRKNLDIIIIIIVVAFVFTIFYGTFYRRSQGPVQSAEAAATVNNTVISFYDLENQFRNFISQFDNQYLNQLDENSINYLKRMTLESMINNELLYQEAKSRKVKVANDEVNAKLNAIKANFPSDTEFQNYLRYQGFNINDLRESIKRDLMVTNLIDSINEGIVIPPEDIQKYYEENQKMFSTPNQYHLLQMTFVSQEAADKILKKVNLGEDFSTLAKSNSLDSYAQKGGDAGWISEDALPNEVKDILIPLKDRPGVVTPVIKVDNNYQVYKLVETKPAEEKTLDESKEQIRTILENEQKKVKLEHLIAEIREKSKIVISDSLVATGIVESSPSPTVSPATEPSTSPATSLETETTPATNDISDGQPTTTSPNQ